MRHLVILLAFIASMFGATLESKLEVEGNVIESRLFGDLLGIASDKGKVFLVDINTKALKDEVALPNISSFFEDNIPPKIFSVDKIGDLLSIVSEAENGARNLSLYNLSTKETVEVLKNTPLPIKIARFLDENRILLGLMSNELLALDLKTKKEIYRKHLDSSTFSHFELDEKRGVAVSVCESGEVFVVDTKNGSLIKKLTGINKDNIYKTDIKNNTVAVAGQDRKAGIYFLDGRSEKYFEATFLIYAIALSQDGKLLAFAQDDKNNIALIDINSGKREVLKGAESALNTIIFVNNERMISTSDDNKVLFWKLR